MSAMGSNERQVGGKHYQGAGHCPGCGRELQHWDIAWMFNFDCFQYIITKWVFRWMNKGGLEDLQKARHALDKYIEVVEERTHVQGSSFDRIAREAGGQPAGLDHSGHPGPGYTNQG